MWISKIDCKLLKNQQRKIDREFKKCKVLKDVKFINSKIDLKLFKNQEREIDREFKNIKF